MAPESLARLDLEMAVQQIQMGDTSVAFAAGDGCQTPEQRLNALIDCLTALPCGQLAAHRRMLW